MKFVGPERLLFGTDFPFAPRKSIDAFTRYLGEYVRWMKGVREAIDRGNALKTFPRLEHGNVFLGLCVYEFLAVDVLFNRR